jgi:hypothetical protein
MSNGLTQREVDTIDTLARLEKGQEQQTAQLVEIFAQLRRLPCTTEEYRLATLEKQMAAVSISADSLPHGPPKPRTDPANPRITEQDLRHSQELVLAELDGRIDRSVEERVLANEQRLLVVEQTQERRKEQRRAAVKDWLKIAYIAIGIVLSASGGATIMWRCGLPMQQAAPAVRTWGQTARVDAAQPFKGVQ